MYYIMKHNTANAGGYERVATARTEAAAERKARSLGPTINGKKHPLIVWSEKRYDEWHEAEIMPYYRE